MIDALYKRFGEDEELEILFQILQEDVPLLPPSVRSFVTSRNTGPFRSLTKDPHVYSFDLDIRGGSNLNDMQTFAQHALRKIARRNGYAILTGLA